MGWASRYKKKRLNGLNSALSFEEFTKIDKAVGWPEYDNFPIKFFEDVFANSCNSRDTPYYQIFKKEMPQLDTKLRDVIPSLDRHQSGFFDRIKPYEFNLYKAYLHMRSAGASDEELFS